MWPEFERKCDSDSVILHVEVQVCFLAVAENTSLDVVLVIRHSQLSSGLIYHFCQQAGVSPRHPWTLLQSWKTKSVAFTPGYNKLLEMLINKTDQINQYQTRSSVNATAVSILNSLEHLTFQQTAAHLLSFIS